MLLTEEDRLKINDIAYSRWINSKEYRDAETITSSRRLRRAIYDEVTEAYKLEKKLELLGLGDANV